MPSDTALVIGGGIAGMQAALDIANAGFTVTLVEKSPTVGGRMLQFSEVFPTLDCPQCIGTPKMLEVGSHPNIRLRTYAEIVDIDRCRGQLQDKNKEQKSVYKYYKMYRLRRMCQSLSYKYA